jgi:hypothetical protein
MIQINKNPSKKELVWFGVLCLVFFALMGLSVLHKTHDPRVAVIIWSIAGIAIAIYFAVPPARRPVYLAWMYAVYPLGWVLSHVLLAVTFFGVIAPIGLLMRVLSRDVLARKFDPSATTYWVRHDPGSDPDRYFRQF